MKHVYIRCPQFLYDWRHPLLAPKWAGRQRWYHRAALAVIEWIIDRFELWNMRPAFKRMQEQIDMCNRIAEELAEIRQKYGLDSPQATDQKETK